MQLRSIFILSLFSLFFCVSVQAQSDTQEKIRNMEEQRALLNRKLEQSKKQIVSNERDIAAQVSNLNVINARLEERRKAIGKTKSDISSLEKDSLSVQKNIASLRNELKICKDRYADACRFYQSQQVNFNTISFLFSSKSFTQAMTRARYVREYNESVNRLARQIIEKEVALNNRQHDISLIKTEKMLLAADLKKMESSLKTEEQNQRKVIDDLRSKNKQLDAQISKQQKEISNLNKEIDRQIQIAIEEERKRKEEELRRQEAAASPVAVNTANLQLSSDFEKNKGRLPAPISGTYLLVGKYGTHSVDGMKNVQLSNLGIDLQGESGAQAQSVFNGTVSAVFQQGQGELGVLVRHGSYISVYCNLSQVFVKKGDNVTTGQSLGAVSKNSLGNCLLHFQLHKESVKLNPQEWLEL